MHRLPSIYPQLSIQRQLATRMERLVIFRTAGFISKLPHTCTRETRLKKTSKYDRAHTVGYT